MITFTCSVYRSISTAGPRAECDRLRRSLSTEVFVTCRSGLSICNRLSRPNLNDPLAGLDPNPARSPHITRQRSERMRDPEDGGNDQLVRSLARRRTAPGAKESDVFFRPASLDEQGNA